MKIALLGDAAFYGKFCLNKGIPKEVLSTTATFLQSFDYVVLNLETPFALDNAKKHGNKSAYIKSDPANVELLKYLSVDAVCLSNNHMFDFGYDAFEITKEILSDNGIEYFGVEGKDLKINIEGNKIAFSGYCCFSTNPINATLVGVNPLIYSHVVDKLEDDKLNGYNSILSVHAGQEHVNYPNYDHIEMARKLSSVAPFVLYGHHPHVLQGVEEVKDSLFAYSLGNFCFDDVYTSKSPEPLVKMTDNNKESAILSLEYTDSKLVGHEMIPIFDGALCEGEQKEQILERISDYSSELKIDRDKYNKYRNELLSEYLNNRKKRRDFKWYLKRLNYNSYRMIINSRKNGGKYIEHLKKHL